MIIKFRGYVVSTLIYTLNKISRFLVTLRIKFLSGFFSKSLYSVIKNLKHSIFYQIYQLTCLFCSSAKYFCSLLMFLVYHFFLFIKTVVDSGTPTRPRRNLNLPVLQMPPQRTQDSEFDSKLQEIMKMNGILSINGQKYQTDMKDLEHLGELGNGTCGHVVKMKHRPSGVVIAVKQMRRSGNAEENKRIIMDLDVVLKSHDCPYIVQCLGCFITESDVWICMELMATCLDKLLKRSRQAIPEEFLGKVTVAVSIIFLHFY